MSELKVRKFFEVVPTSKVGFYQPGAFVDGYLKSEADRVIAEKDAAIAELNQKLEDVNEIIKTARQMLEDAKATLYTENERLKEGKNDYKQFYQDTFKELESLKASHYAEMVDAGMRERRLRRALWKLKALYFFRMFQWSMEGKRLAPEDDEPEDFFMEYMGKHTKRKSEWDKEADMFDDARIVCIKKAEEYK